MAIFNTMEDPLKRPVTPTLIFAVAARIGGGASFVTNGLLEELKAFGYIPIRIKITEKLLAAADQHSEYSSAAKRILDLQNKGNNERKKLGNNILAALSVKDIFDHMQQKGVLDSCNLRYAYVIDSLKHPDEVDLLRNVFRDAFCMIGVVADDSVRKRRLWDQKQIEETDFMDLSRSEQSSSNQRPIDAILKSDYFFENNYDIPDKINHECKRLLNLLFQSSIVTPRQDEYGMRLAFMAAKRSACLSRQVGAAIISNQDTVLATGCNDVPRFGGGLYSSEALVDNRCFAKSMMCHNDREKTKIADEIVDALKASGQIPGLGGQHLKEIRKALLEKTRLKQLIEFSRAVHAEMDALISVARTAVPGLVGSTLYVTTYPCHNCAKHIIDAGIKRVVFVEPYVKSLAQRLHADAINNPLEDCNNNKVSFDNYGGVSAERYSHFFSMHEERKKNGKSIRRSLEKDKLLPLGAQEISNLKLRLDQFDKWLKRSSVKLITYNKL